MTALVLLSGGLDSSTTLALARAREGDVMAVSYDYAQRHHKELDSAKTVANFYGIKQIIVKVDFSTWATTSALTSNLEVPDYVGNSQVPITYVPARNSVFLAIACSIAESHSLPYVYYGANSLDYSGYPDCRPEFVEAFNKMIELGTRYPPQIVAPLISMSKAEIIRLGLSLNVPYQLTWSCYRGGDKPCGTCDSCVLRAKGWAEIDEKDPAL